MSLLRTAARASVATRVVGNTQRRQQQKWAAQDAAAAQAAAAQAAATQPAVAKPISQVATPAPAAGATMLEQLAQLGQLRDAGILTEVEFEVQKHRILSGN